MQGVESPPPGDGFERGDHSGGGVDQRDGGRERRIWSFEGLPSFAGQAKGLGRPGPEAADDSRTSWPGTATVTSWPDAGGGATVISGGWRDEPGAGRCRAGRGRRA